MTGAETWTTTRMREALRVHYPRRTASDQVDTQQAALALGVSQRTIQRWTNLADQRPIGPDTVRRRIGRLIPDEQTFVDEQTKLDQFRQGLIWLKNERSRIPPIWRNQGWLQPHALLHIARVDSPLQGLMISRGSDSTLGEIQRCAVVAASAAFPTRIHAEVFALEALRERRAWRVLPPNRRIRTTRFWLTSAPDLTLPSS